MILAIEDFAFSADLSQTYHHLHSEVPALSQTPLQRHTIHIYIKHPWRYHTTLLQSDINWKPLTHIHTHQDTRPLIYTETLHRLLGYLDTWSGFEAAKTAPWPSRGLHHCGKFLEPSDE